MLDFFFAMVAASMSTSGPDDAGIPVAEAPAVTAPAPETGSSSVVIGQGVTTGGGVVVEGTPTPTPTAPAPQAVPAQPGMNMAVVPAGLVAEPQVPSGKFLTATEVKPILNATKGNWVAIREYDGQDLLYVTHLWSWRCGLAAMAISVNDEPMQNWPLPPCHADTATPNAIIESDGLPYLKFRLQSVDKVSIQVVYDDLSMDTATFERNQVRLP